MSQSAALSAAPGKDAGLDAQMGVLGAMLIDPDIVADALSRLAPQDFFNPVCRAVFEAFRDVFAQGRSPDPITVADRLGPEYRETLAQLMDVTPTAANWEEYAAILRRQAAHRRLAGLGERLASAGDLEEAQAIVDQINAAGCGRTGLRVTSLRDCYQDFLDRHAEGKRPPYLTWGIPELDARIYVEPGDFVVLGGYPSAGKTALALQMAYHMAGNHRVGYFYLENNDRKLFDRLVAARSLVPFGKIKRHDLEEQDFAAIVSIQNRLIAPALEFVDASGMTVADLRAAALSRRYDAVVVDYLQKLRADQRRISDFERVSQVSDSLQALGRQTGMLVLALSQLSRPEAKKDGTVPAPGMHSFRQSGQIEQDADVALLLYKEEESRSNTPRLLKIGKNKEGEANKVLRMAFDGDTQTFSRFSPAPEPLQRQRPKQVSFWDGWQEAGEERTPFDGGE